MKIKIYQEPCYDLDVLTNNNLHMHTVFSACAKPTMTVEAIIKEAERCNIQTIALTDHFPDERISLLDKIAVLKKEVAKTNTNIHVLFGAELSGVGIGKYLDTDEENAALDYRLYACNHFHMDFSDAPEDTSPRGWAVFAMAIVDSIAKTGRADAIAHPLIGRFLDFEEKRVVTDAMKDNELGDLLTSLRDNDVAWEINRGAVLGFPDFSKRFWNIGREVGVTFHYGTDAHNIDSIDTKTALDEMKKILS